MAPDHAGPGPRGSPRKDRFPFTSVGPAYQMLGITAWQLAVFLFLTTMLCASPPQGASMRPVPPSGSVYITNHL